jgi:hypothetical protein
MPSGTEHEPEITRPFKTSRWENIKERWEDMEPISKAATALIGALLILALVGVGWITLSRPRPKPNTDSAHIMAVMPPVPKKESVAEPPLTRDFTFVMTREWGEFVKSGAGMCITWQRQDSVAFEVRDEKGNTLVYPRHLREGMRIPFLNSAGKTIGVAVVEKSSLAWPGGSDEPLSFRVVGDEDSGRMRIIRSEKGKP